MTAGGTLSVVDPDRLAPDASNPSVSEVMRPEVVFCLPTTTIDVVAKLMADNDLMELPVIVDRRPVGYVRVDDIMGHLASGNLEIRGSDFAMRPPITPVEAREVLRTPLLLVDERQRVGEVVSLMQTSRSRLALVMHEDERPVGMVTPREVAALLVPADGRG